MERLWAEGPGVVTLPSGRRVRGRGLRRPPAEGSAAPAFGVYLLGRQPEGVGAAGRWVRCPDFRTPDPAELRAALTEAWERAATERVEVGCGGGVGRTGLALACLAVLDGVPPADAVSFVRSRYHRRAVETPWQKRFVRRFPPRA